MNESGQVVSYDDYDPWGLTLAGRSMTSQPNLPNKFTGKERDTDFGLDWDYFGARYYNAEIGRWMAVDPLSEMYPGLSPYNYALNNGILLKDVDGRRVVLDDDEVDGQSGISVRAQRHSRFQRTRRRPGFLPFGFAAYLTSRVLGEVTPANDIIRATAGVDPFNHRQLTKDERLIAGVVAGLSVLPIGKLSKAGFKITERSFAGIVANHYIGKAGKTLFPKFMSKTQIKALVIEAVDKGVPVKHGVRLFIRYQPKKYGITEMGVWVNTVTKEIETAYPISGTSVLKRE